MCDRCVTSRAAAAASVSSSVLFLFFVSLGLRVSTTACNLSLVYDCTSCKSRLLIFATLIMP